MPPIQLSQWGSIGSIIDPSTDTPGLAIVLQNTLPITLYELSATHLAGLIGAPNVRLCVIVGPNPSTIAGIIAADPSSGLPLNRLDSLGFTPLYETIIPPDSVWEISFSRTKGVGPYVSDTSGMIILAVPLIPTGSIPAPYFGTLAAFGDFGAATGDQNRERSLPRGALGY